MLEAGHLHQYISLQIRRQNTHKYSIKLRYNLYKLQYIGYILSKYSEQLARLKK